MGLMIAELTKDALVQDLSAVLLAAGIVAALFHLLGWPKVIGYIAAGALIRLEPLRSLMIANEASITVLANLGVIFLMLNLGLELNIRKLRHVGGTVFPAAVADLGMMLFFGYAAGQYILGWELIPSLFMGAVICDSSTTLLAKSLAEMKCEKEPFAAVIFGTTISEDVLTIGVMAVLTGLAMTGQFQAGELAAQLGYLGLFLTGVLCFGLLLLPRLLNRLLSRLQDDETMLIIIMGICFGIALVAERMQFSLALGAFLVGAVVAESKVCRRVRANLNGVRAIFSAVFFVTIGLMVDPLSMWANKGSILLFTGIVIAGKTLNCTVASFLTGQSFRESFQIGVGLAQIGDFAYLVALLGVTLLKGASPYSEMYQIAVGVSIITTLLNPFLLRGAGPFADRLMERLPAWVSSGMRNYSARVGEIRQELRLGGRQKAMMRHGIFLALTGGLLAAVLLTGRWFCEVEALRAIVPVWCTPYLALLMWLACHAVVCPLMAAGWLTSRRLADVIAQADATDDAAVMTRLKAAFRRVTALVVMLLTFGMLVLEYLSLSMLIYGNRWILLLLVLMISLGAWKFRERIRRLVQESQQTLQDVMMREEDDTEDAEPAGLLQTLLSHRECVLTLPADAGVIGCSLRHLQVRTRTGATVLRIVRADGTQLDAPGPEDCLAAEDRVFLLCNHDSEARARVFFTRSEAPVPTTPETSDVTVPADSPVIGKSLKALSLRNATGATVISIRRTDGSVRLSPGADEILLTGDVLTVSGAPGAADAVRKFLAADIPG